MGIRFSFGKPHGLTNEEAIVQNVVVSQCGPLGGPRGATGELNVDRLIELQRLRQFCEVVLLGRALTGLPA